MKLILYAILDCLVRTSSSNDVQFASHVFPCSLKMFKNSTQKLLWLWNTVESHLDAANWSSPYCPWTSPSHTASKQLGDTFVNFSGLGSHRPIHFCRAVATSGDLGISSTHFGKARWLVWTLSPKVFLLVYDPQLLLSCQGRFYQAVSDGWVGASRDLLNLVDYIYIYMNIIYIYMNIIYIYIWILYIYIYIIP